MVPDVLLPKNYFSANQIVTFKWADRHHVPNGCLHLFIANVSKTRERSGAYYSTRGYHEGVSRKEGSIRRVTSIQRKSVSTRESSVGLDERADAMHFDFYAEINVL